VLIYDKISANVEKIYLDITTSYLVNSLLNVLKSMTFNRNADPVDAITEATMAIIQFSII